jgi:hypothetical protein
LLLPRAVFDDLVSSGETQLIRSDDLRVALALYGRSLNCFQADHKRFSLATDIDVFFCDPQQPWQRGSNENTNGLLRQYFPKGMDLSDVHQNKLNAVARQLNARPRETLQFYSPAE